MKKLFILLLSIIAINISGYSQCVFDPTITGDTLLCPNDSGSISTQVYDSYQWYKRPFSGSYQLIPGATNQSLSIDAANDAGFYFRVEATLDTCTEFSPEVLIDSWVFLLPYTIIEGDYTIGPNGELILCQGDTILLLSSMPYDTNLQWYDNSNPITGANNDTLIVTAAGSYTWSGAPSICPDYTQFQFIPSDVTVITCPTGIAETNDSKISLESNLVTDFLVVKNPEGDTYDILDISGNKILSGPVHPNQVKQIIAVDQLSKGSYFIKITGKSASATKLFIKM